MSTTSARPPRPPAEDGPDPAGPAPAPATDAPDPGPTFDTKDLKGLPVRDLLRELAAVEARIRSLPFLISRDGGTAVNPEVARLLARQRAVVEQLRRRRVSWTASQPPREHSAAWPPPPWS